MRTDSKIVTIDLARQQCDIWKRQGEKVVFTNGCFDILHRGHIEYLEQARSKGDRLVVAINSDESAQRLKGDARPINHASSRAYLIASLSFVDLVTQFDADTPIDVIKAINPNVLIKGGDYDEDDIVGAALVRSNGGEVQTIPYVEGFSTTSIEQKILSLSRRDESE